MLKAKALKPIYSSGLIIGYTLKDETGKEMNIKSEAIISAIRRNAINIINLKITEDDKLVMIEDKKTYNVKTKEKPVINTDNTQKTEVKSEKRNEYLDKVDRMQYLIEVLNNARKVYEQGTDEVMSNYEYDKLYDELESIEHELGTVLSNSPTINVGYEVVSKLPKEKHEKAMLSLAKTKDREELKSFLQGKEGNIGWKLDGLTVVLTYDGGTLQKAVTRGNGEIGEVVTSNAKQFKNLPMQIPFLGKLVLRGEAVIGYKDFEKINEAITVDDEKYKNPRNLCSGSVRQLDSSITEQRNVKWICFNVVDCDGANIPNEVDKQLYWVKLLGFEVVENYNVDSNNFDEVVSYFETKVTNKEYDIPTDGLVLTFRDRAYGESLGRTAKSPKHSLAFKWEDETAVSSIEYIEWSPSRTGLINPVAVFTPVDIDGSTVSRASVHNVSIFLDLELGYKDRIEVYKANMIIPQISENLDRTGTCEIPSTCPCCGYETEIHQDPKSGVYTLWCPNEDCPAKGNRLLKHFVSRDAMNIDGISGATLEKFVEEGIVTDPASLFNLINYQDEIVSMDGFGYKSFINMINAIEKARDVKLANLIYSLGIPNIGLATAKSICKNFEYDMEKTVTATYDQLIDIEGIGDVIAQSFVDYFNEKENAEHFVRLLKEVRLIKEEISTDTSMSGVVICVTGEVEIFPNRNAIKALVESKGGKLTGSVSRSTNYLVTNDTTSGSRKNRAAKEYGIPILTEEQFIEKFNLNV